LTIVQPEQEFQVPEEEHVNVAAVPL